MGQSRPLFCLFLSFQTNITIFTTNICEQNVHPVYCSRIRTHDLQDTSLLDQGCSPLVIFLNLLMQNSTAAPDLDSVCRKSVVREIDGRKIGIIGYVTPATAYISNPGANVKFVDEIQRWTSLNFSILSNIEQMPKFTSFLIKLGYFYSL